MLIEPAGIVTHKLKKYEEHKEGGKKSRKAVV